MTTDHQPITPLLLAGPTAVGKSAIALLLAERIGGEIISVDSMQVYRGMDIGTAKPSPAEQRRVPHHLLDLLELGECFDAAQFVHRANQAISEIQSRRRVPILCGGTGLYFKAFLEGINPLPTADPVLRKELKAKPMETLLHELRESDPIAYQAIDRQNPRRVVRALEVIRLTGRPFSAQRTAWPLVSRPSPSASRFYCLSRPVDDLRARIDSRVDEMFRRGLVEETRRLLDRGLELNETAMQALGYRQVVEHLHGERSLAETIALVKVRTHQFAKRQRIWFRHQAAARWMVLDKDQNPETVAAKLAGE